MGEHWYRGYGLVLRSGLPLPEFRRAPARAAPDLAIGLDPEAARQWDASGATEADADDFVAAPAGGFVMRVAGIGHYWVHDQGRALRVAPAPGADPVTLRLYLLGSSLGMALHQRGLLVLHGATVLHSGGAALIVGDSGEGKSTLAAGLGRAGHAILGDDTMPLWSAAGGFEVWPGSRLFKLWSDSIEALGGASAGLQPVGDRLEKFFVPNAAEAPDAAVPVRSVVLLAAGEEGRPHLGRPRLERLHGLEAIRALAMNTYRPEYVPLLGREAAHFRLCSELAGAVPVSRLTRPWDIGRLGETLELLADFWAPGAEQRA